MRNESDYDVVWNGNCQCAACRATATPVVPEHIPRKEPARGAKERVYQSLRSEPRQSLRQLTTSTGHTAEEVSSAIAVLKKSGTVLGIKTQERNLAGHRVWRYVVAR